ncbi:MAG: VanZ family protein [Pseudomonadota bacterium]
MRRVALIALTISFFVAVAILVGGLIPRDFDGGSIRRDGPYLHAAAFALLVLPLVSAWPRRWLVIVLGAILFGGAIEVLQPTFDRALEWSDIVANTVGAVSGAILGTLLSKVSRRLS